MRVIRNGKRWLRIFTSLARCARIYARCWGECCHQRMPTAASDSLQCQTRPFLTRFWAQKSIAVRADCAFLGAWTSEGSKFHWGPPARLRIRCHDDRSQGLHVSGAAGVPASSSLALEVLTRPGLFAPKVSPAPGDPPAPDAALRATADAHPADPAAWARPGPWIPCSARGLPVATSDPRRHPISVPAPPSASKPNSRSLVRLMPRGRGSHEFLYRDNLDGLRSPSRPTCGAIFGLSINPHAIKPLVEETLSSAGRSSDV